MLFELGVDLFVEVINGGLMSIVGVIGLCFDECLVGFVDMYVFG